MALILLCTLGGAAAKAAESVRFFAIGDLPYSNSELLLLRTLLAEVDTRSPDFFVHIGDIKSGNATCSQAWYNRIRALFAERPVPVVYSIGDNEWTDCHRFSAGAYDPDERLAALRSTFFQDPAVLRLNALQATWAGENARANYPEIYFFEAGGVLFVNLHLVGSQDNRAHRAEREAREKANLALLEAAARYAERRAPTALVVLLHAHMPLEEPEPQGVYGPMIAALRDFVVRVGKPALLIHGDRHQPRLDRPWAEDAEPALAQMLRLELPATPEVAGILIQVRGDAAEPFSFEKLPGPG
jgi:hypothetical protein